MIREGSRLEPRRPGRGGENDRKAAQRRDRKRRERSPELAEDGVEALDDFMRSNRFNAIQGNE